MEELVEYKKKKTGEKGEEDVDLTAGMRVCENGC